MGKYKNLEEWREELIGKQFGRLTVQEIHPYIRKSTGKRDGFEAICECTCGNRKHVLVSSLIKGLTKSCGCLNKETMRKNAVLVHQWFKEHPEKAEDIYKRGVENLSRWHEDNPDRFAEIVRENVKKAQQWHRDNPEESKKISSYANKKSLEWRQNHLEEAHIILEKATQKSKEWRENNPELAKKISQKAIEQAHITNREIKNVPSSKEEEEIYNYLLSLGYSVERQFLLEGHYFDFRVNNFLVEYHGSIYHYFKYENLNNPESKEPPSEHKEKSYHKNLRDIAIRNSFHLIQVWDFGWLYRKEFVQKLIKDQLSGTANYKDYLEDNLLNNDYGFIIEGEQVELKGVWVSTGYRKIVDENYSKGKVLVFNSGYTKIK